MVLPYSLCFVNFGKNNVKEEEENINLFYKRDMLNKRVFPGWLLRFGVYVSLLKSHNYTEKLF